MNSNKIVSKNSVKRLLRDVASIMKNPLQEQGIYYVHDEQNMYKGTAMIIGPKDTPYENGYYLFHFKYPKNYPFSPPKVTYHTNNGKTRFNPNLYINGKVCISILNTWKGEQWTSCQNIRSVLLTLVTLLNENPLTNEPGFAASHRACLPYKRMVTYMNFKTSILGMVTQKSLPKMFNAYYSIIKKHFLENKENIIEKIKEFESSPINNMVETISIYKMSYEYDYTALKLRFLEETATLS
jgi:ubiquitin-conjugating enzyme E2 Z